MKNINNTPLNDSNVSQDDLDKDLNKYEILKLRTQLNGMKTKLEKRNKRLKELEQLAEERKQSVDSLSAEIGRLKRKLKKQKNL